MAESQAVLARARSTSLDVEALAGEYAACVAVGLRVPGCASVFIPPDDEWFVDPASGSWARLHLRTAGRPHIVNQYSDGTHIKPAPLSIAMGS